MFEEISGQVMAILSITVGGVSIGSIVAMVIYMVRKLRKANAAMDKALTVTEDKIEQAFQNVVLPKNIKLDVSNKIEKPIKEGLQQITLSLEEQIKRIEQGEELILQILKEFSHVQKLPVETQQAIAEYVDGCTSKEVKL